MMQKTEFTPEQLTEVYEKLSAWTNWWLRFRDTNGNGLCEYCHGNDSGWDNSTVFRVSPFMELPDLMAFLSIQAEVLGEIAEKLGKSEESDNWNRTSAQLLDRMLGKYFLNGKPVAQVGDTHEIVESRSLILYLPIILGKRLPEKIREDFVRVLKSPDFYTDFGFATEAISSELYQPNGYWRGPIWAPSTLILVDGLREAGETALAAEAAEKFCRMAKKSGFAENYDALTGEGLRDRAYTWTASVFLVLAHEYLKNE